MYLVIILFFLWENTYIMQISFVIVVMDDMFN